MLDRAGHRSDHSFGRRSDADGLEVVFVDLGAAGALLGAAEEGEPRLSAGDHARAAAMAPDLELRHQWLRTRIATRIVIERAMGPGIRNAEFVIAPGGRPTLGEGLPFFNVAHSGGAALIAMARSAPVGVDLERAGRAIAMSDERRRRIIAAARRLAGNEGFAGAESLAADRDHDVLRAWVRLEAAAKALGTGIGRLLTEEGVVGGAGMPGGSVAAAGLAVRGLDVPRDYVAAIAAEALPEKTEVVAFPGDAAALAAFLLPARA